MCKLEQKKQQEQLQAPVFKQDEQDEAFQQPAYQEATAYQEASAQQEEEQQEQAVPVQEQCVQQERAEANRGLKNAHTTSPVEEARAQKERARQEALRKDETRVRNDKARHGLYTMIKGFVKAGKAIAGKNKGRKAVQENTVYLQSLQMAYDEMYARRLQAETDGTLPEFEQEHGQYYAELSGKVMELKADVFKQMKADLPEEVEVDKQAFEQNVAAEMQKRTTEMRFGAQQRANVVGGTKPAATQYAQNGTKWLVKEAVSCIGINEPNSAIVTEAGYKIQHLVNPDTAIEAFRGQTVGKGIVSYQRMVSGVKKDVDLFRFSRTPEAMTEAEMRRIEELSPQLLREHTTDWLLCNFDTKGENFLVSNDGTGPDRLYGIDKEAAFRPILDEGAQTMSKDYRCFDQETVYNRLFQGFAAGTMNLDLQAVLPQIQRVEAMSDDEYMGTFKEYLKQQGQDRPEKVEEIRANILKRKQGLRMEYRAFFTKLVEERCSKVTPDEAAALRLQFFGSQDGGTFLFAGETAQDWQAERDLKQALEEDETKQQQAEAKAKEADAKDESVYKRRHALYDFSKAFVMGIKKPVQKLQRAHMAEKTDVQIPLSQVVDRFRQKGDRGIAADLYGKQVGQLRREAISETRRTLGLASNVKLDASQMAMAEALLAKKLEAAHVQMTMGDMHDVRLGGTKPMSEFYATDGSRWLAKQAVNCMGYHKLDGALLTEAGANLQKLVDPTTAVDAFVGFTRELGDVSFQRRLENVESGAGKLDLFSFSKHPEIATSKTIAQVQALGSQILREHATDWLLCNFDTKGENFVITKKEGEERVLHGIDKEAAFNKILSPEAQHMSTTYKPHANNTLYNVVFSMYANNQIDLELNDVLPQIEKMEAIKEDDAYMSLFSAYMERKELKDPENAAAIRQNILRRKTGLRKEYGDFFSKLVLERCKKLHPDEAAALKDRYFGPGGAAFRFPEGNGA